LMWPAMADDYNATLGPWLRRHGTPERAIDAFIGPVVASACNETVDDVALGFAHKVLRDGFLAARTAFRLGIADRPIGDLLTEPVRAHLAARDCVLKTNCTLRRLRRETTGGWIAETVDGRRLEADRLVLAVPFDQAARICAGLGDAGRSLATSWEGLRWSPIVGVHLWFDRPVECPPALALPGSASQWLFHKPPSFGLMPGEASYLTAAVSADRRMAALSGSDIAALVAEDARQALPGLRAARNCRHRVVKEHKATFSVVPGAERLRPSQRTPVTSLYLAGDWTRTGWPSTMEGAARSGNLAASELLTDLRLSRPAMPPDLAADWPARAIMRLGSLLAGLPHLGSGSRSI
ncbi:MAG: FAD-dependent oxidoreductase, partial [Armatimonadetes bacterium]|nr:FAD-dependent oxidoreductase [Armatimonadota bacterium]